MTEETESRSNRKEELRSQRCMCGISFISPSTPSTCSSSDSAVVAARRGRRRCAVAAAAHSPLSQITALRTSSRLSYSDRKGCTGPRHLGSSCCWRDRGPVVFWAIKGFSDNGKNKIRLILRLRSFAVRDGARGVNQ
ncbi:hypothetical protein EVAR_75683_1 [Eumeta japonica]|uniref:Uncharacterized protein n=1 Tax=Eumeta variegata TaxID=151549 RepID=A0A4C1W3Y3_EUMVA|nr:hypothetical protein EVAR_75683_1 [Eumeta japonica]